MNLEFRQKWLNKLDSFKKSIDQLPSIINYGRLISINGAVLQVIGLRIPIGTYCCIKKIVNNISVNIYAEVIGFIGDKILLLSFDDTSGIVPGACVIPMVNVIKENFIKKAPLSMHLLGRILNSQGEPLDSLPSINSDFSYFSKISSINPLKRKPILEVLDTGIRAINGLLTIGRGQRIGLFSGSGIGKSILLGMMAKYTKADVIVIALIGERGREIKEFIEKILGSVGLLRSVVIAAPADVSPILQIQGASYATSIAEYFRSQDKHVLLIMDSLTRYAMAQREIALSMGELPVSKGYPSSVFSKIPHLIERTGNTDSHGSITAFYTILTETEDELHDPVAYIARSILDGHIILSRYYADLGHYPAIDIEQSISRLMPDIVSTKQYSNAVYFKKLVASYQRNRDLINIGAYISGNDPILDHAIKLWPELEKFLQQEILEKSDYLSSYTALKSLFTENN